MKRGGRPVIYVPYKSDEPWLEDGIWSIYENSEDNEEIRRQAKLILGHLKPMGDRVDEFKYYDEMEWRIVGDGSHGRQYITRGK